MKRVDPQTSPENVRYLAASQRLVSRAKSWRAVQLWVVVIVPTGLALYGALQAKSNFVIPFAGFVSAILDAWLFNSVITSQRYRAAQLADEYDSRIVGVVPSVVRQRASPAAEVVAATAKRHLRIQKNVAVSSSFYTARLVELLPVAAGLLCQRINAGRDEPTRSAYITSLFWIAGSSIFVLLLVWGLAGWEFDRLITNVLLPVVPAATWLGREVVEHRQARDLQDRLRCVIDDHIWSRLMNPVTDSINMAQDIEAVRSMQFMLRAMEPLLPEWLCRHHRQEQDNAVGDIVNELINDAIACGFGSRAAKRRGRSGTGER